MLFVIKQNTSEAYSLRLVGQRCIEPPVVVSNRLGQCARGCCDGVVCAGYLTAAGWGIEQLYYQFVGVVIILAYTIKCNESKRFHFVLTRVTLHGVSNCFIYYEFRSFQTLLPWIDWSLQFWRYDNVIIVKLAWVRNHPFDTFSLVSILKIFDFFLCFFFCHPMWDDFKFFLVKGY